MNLQQPTSSSFKAGCCVPHNHPTKSTEVKVAVAILHQDQTKKRVICHFSLNTLSRDCVGSNCWLCLMTTVDIGFYCFCRSSFCFVFFKLWQPARLLNVSFGACTWDLSLNELEKVTLKGSISKNLRPHLSQWSVPKTWEHIGDVV